MRNFLLKGNFFNALFFEEPRQITPHSLEPFGQYTAVLPVLAGEKELPATARADVVVARDNRGRQSCVGHLPRFRNVFQLWLGLAAVRCVSIDLVSRKHMVANGTGCTFVHFQ